MIKLRINTINYKAFNDSTHIKKQLWAKWHQVWSEISSWNTAAKTADTCFSLLFTNTTQVIDPILFWRHVLGVFQSTVMIYWLWRTAKLVMHPVCMWQCEYMNYCSTRRQNTGHSCSEKLNESLSPVSGATNQDYLSISKCLTEL